MGTDYSFQKLDLSFDLLKNLKRNSYSKNIIDELAKKYSSIDEACKALVYNPYKEEIESLIPFYLLQNPFATCHALYDVKESIPYFLKELIENEYGDFLFALRINFIRKLLLIDVFNPFVDESKKTYGLFANVTGNTSFYKLTEFFRSNSKLTDNSVEIGDFGFFGCAMALDHSYGIQDILSVVFRILRNAYKNDLKTKLESAIFAIPLDNAKYGLVTTCKEFDSFSLTGRFLDIKSQRDLKDINDSILIYKTTQYKYRKNSLK